MVQVARSLSDWVIRSIEREMPTAWDAVEGKASINRRSFNTSFGNGAAAGVWATVTRIIADRQKGRIGAEQLSNSQALMLLDQDKKALQESENYLEKLYPRRRSGTRSQSDSPQGYAAGRTFGSSLSLNGQMGQVAPVQQIR